MEEVEFGNGDDTLIFNGAVNSGSGHYNLLLQGAEEEPGEFEVTEFNGGGGTNRLNVLGRSYLELEEVENFSHLAVLGRSTLILEGEAYTFDTPTPGSGTVGVEGGSMLWLSAPEMTFNTPHLALGGPAGGDKLQPASYYDAFNPGGILRIGAEAQEEEDEGGGGDEEESFLANVTITTGSSTFETAGTIDMVNGLAGDRLTVVGP